MQKNTVKSFLWREIQTNMQKLVQNTNSVWFVRKNNSMCSEKRFAKYHPYLTHAGARSSKR
jgi:hypothetical protein